VFDAIQQRDTITENGMTTNSSSLKHCVNLFFQIGAMRGVSKDKLFAKVSKAFNEDSLTTIRIIFWARDVRGGAGERQIFRDCLLWLCDNHRKVLHKNIHLISEYGRWDDVLTLVGTQNCWDSALDLVKTALENKDGLCAKWMPRKGTKANIIRRYLKVSPKVYRKLLVGLTDVVETKMCAKDWSSIEYSKLPSLASSRYQKTFMKNDESRYEKYKEALVEGTTKINAGAVYPYDIIKSIIGGGEEVVAQAQWDSLPNYMEGINERVLPVVDVSGSMESPAGKNGNVTCMDVSTSLGMYISERNEGVFKNSFITFSSEPQLQLLEGSLSDKITQLERADWGMSTDLQATFKLILDQAVKHNVPVSEMPTKVLILSDMEFDSAISGYYVDEVSDWNPTAQEMIKGMYEEAGYEMPGIVYWNIQSRQDNVPTRFDEMGTALVSGFSPSIMKSILSCQDMTPYNMMMETIGSARYEPIKV
jgi:hypothetical protein